MKVHFLARILLFCLLTLEDSEAVPLKTEKEQDKPRKAIVKVGQDCKTSGLEPKEGSICLKLTVVAGVNVNFGLDYEEKDKKKNSENISKSDKNEDGKQSQRQEKILNKDQGRNQEKEDRRRKQEQEQRKRDQKKRLKDPRST